MNRVVDRVGLEPTTNGLKGRCSTTELPIRSLERRKVIHDSAGCKRVPRLREEKARRQSYLRVLRAFVVDRSYRLLGIRFRPLRNIAITYSSPARNPFGTCSRTASRIKLSVFVESRAGRS